MNRIIKNLIINYENKKSNLKDTIFKINKISYKKIDKNDLVNYWKYTSLDELLTKPIDEWEEIDDKESILLIQEILDNLTNDIIIDRNSEALEKKYNKSKGTISNWIFIDDICDSIKILDKLKKNDIILL